MTSEFPKLNAISNYTLHIDSTVETEDNEDHLYHGIMFDVKVKDSIPIEALVVKSLWIRGRLGEVNIYYRDGQHKNMYASSEGWTKIYSREHPVSRELVECKLPNPLSLIPGKKYGLYIHSPTSSESIVYDDERHPVTFENCFLKVFSGLACISSIPFGPDRDEIDWDWPWRPNREFVGKISFGIRYKLWRPIKQIHQAFLPSFRAGVLETTKCFRSGRMGIRLYRDILFLILNMLRFDWFEEEDKNLLYLEDRTRVSGQRIGWAQGHWTVYRQKILEHRLCFMQRNGILTTAMLDAAVGESDEDYTESDTSTSEG